MRELYENLKGFVEENVFLALVILVLIFGGSWAVYKVAFSTGYAVVFLEKTEHWEKFNSTGCEIVSARWASSATYYNTWGYEVIARCPSKWVGE